jgi:hypothetical protein
LLNAFNGEEKNKDKLIEYVMKKNKDRDTCLHEASKYGYEEIVYLLLNVFREENRDKLIICDARK